MFKLLSSSLVLVVLLGFCGCGKKAGSSASPDQQRQTRAGASIESDPASVPPPPPPPAAPGEPVPTGTEPPAAVAGTETEGRNGFLDRVYSSDPQVAVRAMNQFIEGRNMTATTELKSLEQLVKEGGWPRMPKAPAGFRYVLDPQTRIVVLVK